MARRKRGEEDSGGPGVPDWIMTFSDMTSLLLTFFVLLFTFSTIEEEDLRKITGARTGATKPFPRRNEPQHNAVRSPLPSLTKRGEDTLSPHDRAYEEARRKLEDSRIGTSRGATAIELTDTGSGMWIEFPPSSSFSANSAVPNHQLREELEKLAAVLGNFEVEIEFGGHAHDFFPTPEFATVDELCLTRARAAFEVYREAVAVHGGSRSRLDPGRIVFDSYGESYPHLGFDTSHIAGRQAQRRVTMLVRKQR